MRVRLLLLLFAVSAFAGDPYRAGTRDAASEVIGTLSDCHEAQAIVLADASGATVRANGLAGRIRISQVLPPSSVYRPGSGWLSLSPVADAKKDAVIDAVWIATSDPVRYLSLREGAVVLGTLYHESGGVVLQVDLVKGERPQDEHHDFATPDLAVQDYVNAVLGANARGVRKVLAGAAYDEFEKGMEAHKTDEEGMAALATKMTETVPAVTDVLRVHGQPAACWVRLLQRDQKRVTYHLVLAERGWLIDNLASEDPRPDAHSAAQAHAQEPPQAAEGKSALAVTVTFPAESMQEGERGTATFGMRNQGTAPVILISIEPDQALEQAGGDLSKALQAGEVEVDSVGGTIEVRSMPPQAAAAPSTYPNLRDPLVLGPGQDMKREVVFKAPAGHLYAIHWRVTYATLQQALAEGAVYAVSGIVAGTGPSVTTYGRATSKEALGAGDVIKVDGLTDPGVAHVALAVEVKPREFSFADAVKRAGIVPSASTWFEPAQVWALSLNGRMWIVRPDGHMFDLATDYVPLLSSLQLSNHEDVHLVPPPGPKDEFAAWLDKNATPAQVVESLDTAFYQVQDLLETLKEADALGFVVTGGGWKKKK